MSDFDEVIAWRAGLSLRGGVPMVGGDTSLQDMPVTKQAKLPTGWTDVVSGTSAGGERLLIAIQYKVIEDVEPLTGFTAFPIPWGGTTDDVRKVEPDVPARAREAKKNAALALLGKWLKEADEGVDERQQRHLRDVKRALDEGRAAGQKLFGDD